MLIKFKVLDDMGEYAVVDSKSIIGLAPTIKYMDSYGFINGTAIIVQGNSFPCDLPFDEFMKRFIFF